MKIILDAMGGDNAPEAAVLGAIQAEKELGVPIILVGRGEEILAAMRSHGIQDLPEGMRSPTPTMLSICMTIRPPLFISGKIPPWSSA